jgi:hypothetical protein
MGELEKVFPLLEYQRETLVISERNGNDIERSGGILVPAHFTYLSHSISPFLTIPFFFVKDGQVVIYCTQIHCALNDRC